MEETRLETITRLKDVGTVSGSCVSGIFMYLDLSGYSDRILEILDRAREYGAEIIRKDINSLGRYPMFLEVALLLAVYDVLGWNEVQIKELGRNIPRVSILVKFFLKYFVSLEASTGQAKMYWRRHYDFAELDVTSTDIEHGQYTVEVRGFDIHPLYSEFLCGFLETMIGFVAPHPLSSEVSKYSLGGDGLNQFRFFYKEVEV